MFIDLIGVNMANPYEEGSPEAVAFDAGAESERVRLRKVLDKYHKTFCGGDILDHKCTKTMEIQYMYDFVVEARSLK